MLTIRTQDGLVSLDIQQQTDANSGTGWVSGCTPSLVARDDALEVTCSAGDVWVNNASVSVAGQSVILEPGDDAWPRKDTVYVDALGDLQVATGAPLPVPEEYEGRTARNVPQPSPPDLADIDGVAIAEVWVPPGVVGASDLDDADTDYVRDRRLPVFPSALATTDDLSGYASANHTHDHANLENVLTDQHHTRPSAGTGLSETNNTFNLNVGAEALARPTAADSIALAATAPDNEYFVPIFIPSGKSVTLYAWGLQLTDGTNDTNVQLAFYTQGGFLRQSLTASQYAENAAGIETIPNSSSSTQMALIGVENNGSTDHTPDGGGANGVRYQWNYRVE